MIKGFKNVWDDITDIYETQLNLIQSIGNLNTKANELEKKYTSIEANSRQNGSG
jgi:hypothetical protein